MTTRVLISFFCDDRPGVIQTLSRAIDEVGGAWLDSQLTRLGGRFAGILQAQVPVARRDDLEGTLANLSREGITATLTAAGETPDVQVPTRRITVLGPDRPGIVHEMTRALVAAGFNVRSMSTAVETAPMSGEPLFRADATIEVLEGSRLEELEEHLEAMAEAMTLDIDIVAA